MPVMRFLRAPKIYLAAMGTRTKVFAQVNSISAVTPITNSRHLFLQHKEK